ncbi:MAG: hypothetical protein ABIL25_07250 [candidate division WOR-3 bacterium]
MMLLSAFCLFLAVPRFQGPYPVLSGGVPIDVGTYSIPFVADWTQDGRKDLIVGQFDSGFVRCYPNVGPDSAPVFDGFFYLEASGERIRLPFS